MSQFLSPEELARFGFASYGENVLVHRMANIVFPERVSLGSNVRIDGFVNLVASGPVRMGSYIHISAFCNIAARGGLEMEDFSALSAGVKIYTSSDDYGGSAMTNPTVPERFTNVAVGEVVLHRHVIIGANSVILPGVEIGEGSSVGALSLVNRNLDPWGVYGGVPAKRIMERKRDLLAMEARLLAGADPGAGLQSI